jgi:hypothetical protein
VHEIREKLHQHYRVKEKPFTVRSREFACLFAILISSRCNARLEQRRELATDDGRSCTSIYTTKKIAEHIEPQTDDLDAFIAANLPPQDIPQIDTPTMDIRAEERVESIAIQADSTTTHLVPALRLSTRTSSQPGHIPRACLAQDTPMP